MREGKRRRATMGTDVMLIIILLIRRLSTTAIVKIVDIDIDTDIEIIINPK